MHVADTGAIPYIAAYCGSAIRILMDFATRRLLSVILTVAASITAVRCDGEKPSVYFALMVSSAPTLNTSDAVVSAVDRALAVINNDNSILPEVRLRYSSVLDTEVRQHS